MAGSADTCEGLSADQQRWVDLLLLSQHPYSGCRESLSVCLKQTPVAPSARRMAREICRLARKGQSKEEIERAMANRAQSMVPSGEPASIVADERFMAGDPQAPVILAVYACGSSVPCAKMIPSLHAAITSGTLKGKARLVFRPFYLENQEESAQCGRALVAAAAQNMFWPYLLHLYYNQDNFKLCMLGKWADVNGLDRDAFDMAFHSSATTEYLAASRQEAIRNKVDSAPGVFIDGRKYVYELTAEAVIDLAEEEWEMRSYSPR